jgi:phosphoribosylaminoimidazolecarboxamide formyltransferase/IMP cyclohydrolase
MRIFVLARDTTGLEKFKALKETWEILAVGPAVREFSCLGIQVVPFGQITENSEPTYSDILGALNLNILRAVVADRTNSKHLAEMQEHKIVPIDVVIINFQQETLDTTFIATTLIRAAAGNFRSVAILVSPDDYDNVIREITCDGNTSLETRERLATKALRFVATHDNELAGRIG